MKHILRTMLHCLFLLVICIAETVLLAWLVAMQILPQWVVTLVLFSIPFLVSMNGAIWRCVQSPKLHRLPTQRKRSDVP